MGKREKIAKVKNSGSQVDLEPESANASNQAKKVKKVKKRSAPDVDTSTVGNDKNPAKMHDRDEDYDLNEPTLGEKLESLKVLEDAYMKIPLEKELSPDIKPPSADSVHVMLKQALNAEDHELLLKCLCSRDDKVISNTISQLSPSDVLKLLNSLISITQSRGSVVVYTLPWLRGLLVQHAGSIMAQESSLFTLNSLYQLIESRTSTFGSALQLSSCLDYLFGGVLGDEVEEESMPLPFIYEDKDSDEETNEESGGEFMGDVDSHDSEGSDVMSQ